MEESEILPDKRSVIPAVMLGMLDVATRIRTMPQSQRAVLTTTRFRPNQVSQHLSLHFFKVGMYHYNWSTIGHTMMPQDASNSEYIVKRNWSS